MMRDARVHAFGTLRVHSVLYGNDPVRIGQAIEHLERAADIAIAEGVFSSVSLVYGDCSPNNILGSTVMAEKYDRGIFQSVGYQYFDGNLGSAQGHNKLLENLDFDYVLIMNPDVMMAPNALVELAKPFIDPKVGIVEGKQLPIEHPKVYSLSTGETSWAATACTLIPAALLKELGGFDHRTFFLYCDDVDFSWRARLAGRKVIYQPSASAFHDKRLGRNGAWMVGAAEKYYSAEAALLLAYKYSREDLVTSILGYFQNSGEDALVAAAREYERRRDAGELPPQLDGDHQVAEFTDGAYATHRFGM